MSGRLDRKLVKQLSGKASTEFASIEHITASDQKLSEVRLANRYLLFCSNKCVVPIPPVSQVQALQVLFRDRLFLKLSFP